MTSQHQTINILETNIFLCVHQHIKEGVTPPSSQAEEETLIDAAVNKLHLSVRPCLKDKPGQYLSDY